MKNCIIKGFVVGIMSLSALPLLAQSETFEKEVFAGVSLNQYVGKDADGLKLKPGFNVGITGRYYFYGDIFADGSLSVITHGYKSEVFESSGPTWDDWGANYDENIKRTFVSYNISIPLAIGYRFNVSEDLNLKFKVGPYFSYAFAGSEKIKGYNTIYPDIHGSETEYIDESYSLSDISDFKNFEYGIHVNVAADYKRFLLSTSYQRSLTKQFGYKEYGQNINISLGYRF